jgi:hypothetical protein
MKKVIKNIFKEFCEYKPSCLLLPALPFAIKYQIRLQFFQGTNQGILKGEVSLYH